MWCERLKFRRVGGGSGASGSDSIFSCEGGNNVGNNIVINSKGFGNILSPVVSLDRLVKKIIKEKMLDDYDGDCRTRKLK